MRVYVRGLPIPAGIDQDGNIVGLDIDYEIDQLPPTAAMEMVNIPDWVKRDDDIWIDAGYDGYYPRVFTGKVKKRRHSIRGETMDCVGRTNALTRPYIVATLSALTFDNIDAETAVRGILALTDPPFEPVKIDATVADLMLGTAKTAIVNLAPPSDMIHKIVDIDGHRMYETPDGTLVIRQLLEAPAPIGIRLYSTNAGEDDTTQDTQDTYPDSNIDTALKIGDAGGDTARSMGVTPSTDGTLVTVSMWLKKVGAPTDKLYFDLRTDDGAGLPSSTVLGGGSYSGSLLSTSVYTKVTFQLPAHKGGSGTAPSKVDTIYHLVIYRSGANDAANYYEIGADTSAPSYAGGGASVFDGATWTASAGTAISFEITSRVYPALRILDISDDENEDQVKKKVYVRGATLSHIVVGGPDAGSEVQVQIGKDPDIAWVTISNDLVSGNPELFSMVYTNDLIDTALQAAKTAARLGNKFHRILDTVQLRIPFDPLIALGATVTLDDPNVTGKKGNWWVFAYRHTLNKSVLETQLSLYGGDQSGTTGFVLPLVDFTMKLEQELIGTTVQVLITFTDNSKGLNAAITNYHWTDTYSGGPMDISGPTKWTVTRAYNPAIDDDFVVRLTVTDSNGQTNFMEKPVHLSTTNQDATLYLPALACAAGNTCMYSPDGAQTWNDIATPNGLATSVEMYMGPDPTSPPFMVYGTTTGRVYRSIDENKTLDLKLNLGSGHPIADIAEMLFQPGRLFLVTTTGLVYQSVDWGGTWLLYANLADVGIVRRNVGDPDYALGNIFIDPTPCSKIIAGVGIPRLWVCGGNGLDPATWEVTNWIPDGPNAWNSDIIPGKFPPLTSSGDASDTVIDFQVSPGGFGELELLFKGRNNGSQKMGIYGPPNFFEFVAPYKEFAGLPDGVDGRGIVNNANQLGIYGAVLNNKNFYRMTNQPDNDTWEELVGVLPGTVANRPNMLGQLSAWIDVFLSAMDEGIAKTIDFGDTWGFIRPNAGVGTTWPAGAKGYDLSWEYKRPTTFRLLISVYDDVAHKTATLIRNNTAAWVMQSQDAAKDWHTVRLYTFPSMTRIFRTRNDKDNPDPGGATPSVWETLQKSDDLGKTWVNAVLTKCADIAIAANGWLWAIAAGADTEVHRVYFSSDGGDTWTEVPNFDTRLHGGFYARYNRIACDPNDANRVAALAFAWDFGSGGPNTPTFAISNDATAGVAANFGLFYEGHSPVTFTQGFERTNFCLVFDQSGSIYAAYEHASAQRVLVDKHAHGESNYTIWTNVYDKLSSGNEPPRVMFMGGHNIYLMHASADSELRSEDEGVSWDHFPDLGATVHALARGYAWEPTTDTLYAGAQHGLNHGDIQTVFRLIDAAVGTIDPAAAWTDVSAGIFAATGMDKNVLCSEGMATLR
jgi:hypothetical protein